MTNEERDRLEQLERALINIRERAMGHPLFDEEKFWGRDTDGLAKAGGDTCDWTMIAILADDALKGLK